MHTEAQNQLRQNFDYDPETGWFTNRFSRGCARINTRAGSPTGHGYRRIILGGEKHYEHHLAWLYVHGEYPNEIGHKDGNRSNNAISNLRLATRTQNCFNAERTVVGISGLRGAYLNRRSMKWISQIQIGSQVKYLGTFNTPEEAHRVFMAAVEYHHGEFAFHKRSTNLET